MPPVSVYLKEKEKLKDLIPENSYSPSNYFLRNFIDYFTDERIVDFIELLESKDKVVWEVISLVDEYAAVWSNGTLLGLQFTSSTEKKILLKMPSNITFATVSYNTSVQVVVGCKSGRIECINFELESLAVNYHTIYDLPGKQPIQSILSVKRDVYYFIAIRSGIFLLENQYANGFCPIIRILIPNDCIELSNLSMTIVDEFSPIVTAFYQTKTAGAAAIRLQDGLGILKFHLNILLAYCEHALSSNSTTSSNNNKQMHQPSSSLLTIELPILYCHLSNQHQLQPATVASSSTTIIGSFLNCSSSSFASSSASSASITIRYANMHHVSYYHVAATAAASAAASEESALLLAALQQMDASIGFEAVVIDGQQRIYHFVYTTAYDKLHDRFVEVDYQAFLPPQAAASAAMIDVEADLVTTIYPASASASSSIIQWKDIPIVGDNLGQELTLWEASQLMSTRLPCRRQQQGLVNDQTAAAVVAAEGKRSAKQALYHLLEAAMALELPDLIVHCIHDQSLVNNITHRKEYSLGNVQDIFAWVLGDGSNSSSSSSRSGLQATLQEYMQGSLQGSGVAYLLTKEGTAAMKSAAVVPVPASWLLALKELQLLAKTIEEVTQALYRRKMTAIRQELFGLDPATTEDNKVDSNSKLDDLRYGDDIISHALVELQMMTMISEQQRRWIQAWQLMTMDSKLTFTPCQPQTGSMEMMVIEGSSAAAAQDMPSNKSLISQHVALRRVHPAMEKLLPEYLTDSGLLFDHLLRQVVASTGGKGDGSNSLHILASFFAATDGDTDDAMVAAAMEQLILLPCSMVQAKKQELLSSSLSSSDVSYYAGYVGMSMKQVREALQQEYLTAIRLVLYILLACYILTYKNEEEEEDGAEDRDWFAWPLLAQLAETLSVPLAEVQLILACVLIDHHLSVEMVVKRLCHGPDEQKPLLHVLLREQAQQLDEQVAADHDLAFHLVKRLLAWNETALARQLLLTMRAKTMMQHNSSSSQIVQLLASKEGIVAYIAAIPPPSPSLTTFASNGLLLLDHRSGQSWKAVWQEARDLCEYSYAIHHSHLLILQTIQEMTRYLCRWCIQEQCFSSFLSEELTYLEVEVVIAFLKERAERDIQPSIEGGEEEVRSPSPAVDTLFACLLQQKRMEDAQALHEAHALAVTRSSYRTSEESQRSIEDRATLLRVYQRKVFPIPAVDYQMIQNLQRSGKILDRIQEMKQMVYNNYSSNNNEMSMN